MRRSEVWGVKKKKKNLKQEHLFVQTEYVQTVNKASLPAALHCRTCHTQLLNRGWNVQNETFVASVDLGTEYKLNYIPKMFITFVQFFFSSRSDLEHGSCSHMTRGTTAPVLVFAAVWTLGVTLQSHLYCTNPANQAGRPFFLSLSCVHRPPSHCPCLSGGS